MVSPLEAQASVCPLHRALPLRAAMDRPSHCSRSCAHHTVLALVPITLFLHLCVDLCSSHSSVTALGAASSLLFHIFIFAGKVLSECFWKEGTD